MKLNSLLGEKIEGLIIPIDKIPVVYENVFFKEAIDSMNKFKLGIVCITDKNNKLKGIFTDGDIRRKLIKIQKPFSAFFVDNVLVHTNKKPLVVDRNNKIIFCLNLMYSNKIWDLPVINKKKELVGLLHLHTILNKLIKS